MNATTKTLFMSTLVAGGLSVMATNTSAQTNTTSEQGVITVPHLNVRSTPSTNSNILGTLIQGQSVTIISKTNNWGKISYNGKDAYISLDYVRLGNSTQSQSQSQSQSQFQQSQSQSATVNADRLRVRSAASTSSNILGTLLQGQSVTVLSTSNGWAKISFNGQDAYVSLDFLKVGNSASTSNTPNVTAPTPSQSQSATVNADRLRVRSAASTSSSILGTLLQGQSVTVLSTSNGWAKISFNGQDAYVSLDFLKVGNSASTSNTPNVTASTPSQSQSATVNADRLRVRSAASTSSSILGTLLQNQSVSILSTNNGWAKISFNGQDAYVSLDFLKVGNSASNSNTPNVTAPTPSQPQSATVNADRLLVRSAASTSSNILGTLLQGQSVTVLSTSNGWAKISFNGQDAFVSLDFLKVGNSASNSNTPNVTAPTPSQSQSATVNADRLHVRSAASTSSSILGTLLQGQSVTILSTNNGWAKISFNGQDAFVSLDFLKVDSTTNSNTTTQSPSTNTPPLTGSIGSVQSTKTITVPQVTVQESATYSSKSLGTISKGSSVSILSQDGEWIKILYNNAVGYIPVLAVQPLAQEQTTTVTASVLNVRDNPSLNGNIIGKLNKGQAIQVISSQNGWSKIQYNGSYAYVSTSFLNQSTSDVSYAVVTPTSTMLHGSLGTAESTFSSLQTDSYISRNGQIIDMKNGFVRTNDVVNIYDRNTNKQITYVAANTDLKFEKAVGSLIYITLDGMKGYVMLQDVTLYPNMLHSPTSYYTVNNGNLIYNLYDASSKSYYSYTTGYAPTNLSKGVQYEAFDRTSIGGQDSYQYFEYLPLRVPATYTSAEIDQFIRANSPNSPLIGTGKYFVEAANKYHINVSYLLAHAIVESGWGTSRIAKDKNNLFGFQAVDYNPYGGAASFATLQQGIDYCAQYIDKNYLTPSAAFYNGAFLGDKARGMNVDYASDSNWSNQISSLMHKMSVMYGNRDYHSYQLAKIPAGVQLVQNLAGQKAYVTSHESIIAIKGSVQTAQGLYYELFSDDTNYGSVFVNANNITLIQSY